MQSGKAWLLAAVGWAALHVPTAGAQAGPAVPVVPGQQAEAVAEGAIRDLAARMQAAVAGRDEEAYLTLVDRSDPVFFLEHGRWAHGWTRGSPPGLTLAVSSIAVNDDTASARLVSAWVDASGAKRNAALAVVFRKSANGWLFAGERWSDYRTSGLTVRVQPGLEAAGPQLLALLPAVREAVAATLGFDVSAPVQVKAYADSASLGFMTLLSLPLISGWNEPGEAIKLVVQPGALPSRSTLAHELTHSFLFGRYPRDAFPWWAHEGLAQFVASRFWTDATRREYLQRTVERAAAGQLLDWSAISDFDATPASLWPQVYPQAYAFFRFLDEVYGSAARVAWTGAVGTGSGLDGASQAAAGASFVGLAGRFCEWLAQPPP